MFTRHRHQLKGGLTRQELDALLAFLKARSPRSLSMSTRIGLCIISGGPAFIPIRAGSIPRHVTMGRGYTMRHVLTLALVAAAGLALCLAAVAEEQSPAARGREALFRHPFNPPLWSRKAYETVWQRWGLAEKPADFPAAFRERYGLHPSPEPNEELPLGLTEVRGLLGKGVGITCLLCHSSSIFGQTYLGLGNPSLDQQAIFDELGAGDGHPALPFVLSHVRGTTDAVAPVAFLMQYRDADLNVQKPVQLSHRNDVCSDPPAWWLLKKKRTRDWTGAIDARSDRVDMAFLLTPFNSAETIKKQEPVFADIQAFVRSVEAPRYPLPVDDRLAGRGRDLYGEHCAKCHGAPGPNGSYPNKIIPLEKIGTDPNLVLALTAPLREYYNKSWFARQLGPDGTPYHILDHQGYQAPPLDGVWATAPYFHNGSAPTVYHVLNTKARPAVFTRSYRTGREDYDPVRLGWKVTALDQPPDPGVAPFERRKVYDTTQPGRSNKGHTFGDQFTDEERLAVIEYLKTF